MRREGDTGTGAGRGEDGVQSSRTGRGEDREQSSRTETECLRTMLEREGKEEDINRFFLRQSHLL